MTTIELINILRVRPGMYIGRNSIFCLKSFIDGWYFRNIEEDVNIGVLNDFYSWLQKYYKIYDSRNWDELLFLVFKDEKKSLDVFFTLFDEFIKSSPRSG